MVTVRITSFMLTKQWKVDMKLVCACLEEGKERQSQREMYADGDTVGPLALGLMGYFLVWIGVSFSVGFRCGLTVSFLFCLTLPLHAPSSINLNDLELEKAFVWCVNCKLIMASKYHIHIKNTQTFNYVALLSDIVEFIIFNRWLKSHRRGVQRCNYGSMICNRFDRYFDCEMTHILSGNGNYHI